MGSGASTGAAYEVGQTSLVEELTEIESLFTAKSETDALQKLNALAKDPDNQVFIGLQSNRTVEILVEYLNKQDCEQKTEILTVLQYLSKPEENKIYLCSPGLSLAQTLLDIATNSISTDSLILPSLVLIFSLSKHDDNISTLMSDSLQLLVKIVEIMSRFRQSGNYEIVNECITILQNIAAVKEWHVAMAEEKLGLVSVLTEIINTTHVVIHQVPSTTAARRKSILSPRANKQHDLLATIRVESLRLVRQLTSCIQCVSYISSPGLGLVTILVQLVESYEQSIARTNERINAAISSAENSTCDVTGNDTTGNTTGVTTAVVSIGAVMAPTSHRNNNNNNNNNNSIFANNNNNNNSSVRSNQNSIRSSRSNVPSIRNSAFFPASPRASAPITVALSPQAAADKSVNALISEQNEMINTVVNFLWDVVTFDVNQSYLCSGELRLVEMFVRIMKHETGYFRIKSLRSVWQMLAFNLKNDDIVARFSSIDLGLVDTLIEIVRDDSGQAVTSAFNTLITLMFSCQYDTSEPTTGGSPQNKSRKRLTAISGGSGNGSSSKNITNSTAQAVTADTAQTATTENGASGVSAAISSTVPPANPLRVDENGNVITEVVGFVDGIVYDASGQPFEQPPAKRSKNYYISGFITLLDNIFMDNSSTQYANKTDIITLLLQLILTRPVNLKLFRDLVVPNYLTDIMENDIKSRPIITGFLTTLVETSGAAVATEVFNHNIHNVFLQLLKVAGHNSKSWPIDGYVQQCMNCLMHLIRHNVTLCVRVVSELDSPSVAETTRRGSVVCQSLLTSTEMLRRNTPIVKLFTAIYTDVRNTSTSEGLKAMVVLSLLLGADEAGEIERSFLQTNSEVFTELLAILESILSSKNGKCYSIGTFNMRITLHAIHTVYSSHSNAKLVHSKNIKSLCEHVYKCLELFEEAAPAIPYCGGGADDAESASVAISILHLVFCRAEFTPPDTVTVPKRSTVTLTGNSPRSSPDIAAMSGNAHGQGHGHGQGLSNVNTAVMVLHESQYTTELLQLVSSLQAGEECVEQFEKLNSDAREKLADIHKALCVLCGVADSPKLPGSSPKFNAAGGKSTKSRTIISYSSKGAVNVEMHNHLSFDG